MVFTNNKKRLDELNILIDGNKIEEVKKTKFLGVIIDNKLSWKIMWLMLWATYQEDWEWLSKLGITWKKRD